jgi:acyl-CoA dehydrogenase
VAFSLYPDHRDNPRLAAVVDRLRDYLYGELAGYEERLGLTHESPLERSMLEPVWRRSRELGFYGIHLPAELGGQGLSYSELAALKEEVSASRRVLATSVLGDMGGPLRVGSIFQYATARQREEYLLPVVKAERACCFSMTETDAGSDVKRMRTTAARVPGGYRINGHKVFSTGGTFADFSILIARMADSDDAYSAFLVDLDSQGVSVEPGQPPLTGQNIESDIVLRNVFVPDANLLGHEGEGLRIGVGRVVVNRLLHCPTALGAARRALQLAIDFASTRIVGGEPLINKQSIGHTLARAAADFASARALTYQALAELDAGKRPQTESFMCKYLVAENAFAIADAALQIHGKAGMVRGTEIEFIWRSLRMFRVLTGSSEIQLNGIAKDLARLAHNAPAARAVSA